MASRDAETSNHLFLEDHCLQVTLSVTSWACKLNAPSIRSNCMRWGASSARVGFDPQCLAFMADGALLGAPHDSFEDPCEFPELCIRAVGSLKANFRDQRR